LNEQPPLGELFAEGASEPQRDLFSGGKKSIAHRNVLKLISHLLG
jgi:hypothetical protein